MVENAVATDDDFKAWLDANERPKSDFLFYGRIFEAVSAREMAPSIPATLETSCQTGLRTTRMRPASNTNSPHLRGISRTRINPGGVSR